MLSTEMFCVCGNSERDYPLSPGEVYAMPWRCPTCRRAKAKKQIEDAQKELDALRDEEAEIQ
jgi:hypothetical protein